MELPRVNFSFSFISVLAEGCKLAVIQLMLFFFFKKSKPKMLQSNSQAYFCC